MVEMTMIDRVARAAYLHTFHVQTDDQREYWWNYAGEAVREMYRGKARAAIEAMREPSSNMQVAGDNIIERSMIHDEVDGVTTGRNALNAETICWTAMIDAALSEQP